MEHDDVSAFAFLEHGGAMGALMRDRDWAGSPLGPPDVWPQSLLSIVELVLQSRSPMFVAWGGRLLTLYNDAFAKLLGSKHPSALGAPLDDVWPETWPDVSSLVAAAKAGKHNYRAGVRLAMDRKGADPRASFSLSFSPAHDERGQVGGICCALDADAVVVPQDRAEAVRAGVAQRMNDERLRQAIAATGMGTFIWHVEDDIAEADERMLALFGLPADGRLSLSAALAKLLHADDRDRYAGAVGRACDPKGSGELRADIRVVLPDASIRWLAVTGQVVFAGAPARAIRMAGTAIDVSERKAVEQALRDSERRLAQELSDARALEAISTRLIREQQPEALYDHMLDAAMALMKADAASIQDFDPERQELRTRAFRNFPADLARRWSVMSADFRGVAGQALGTQKRAVVEDVETSDVMAGTESLAVYRRCGIRAAQATPLRSRSGRLLGMMSTYWRAPHRPSDREFRYFDVLSRQAADLIDRLETEAALKHSEEQLRLATEAADVGFWDVEGATGALYWPPRVKAMFGISPDVPVSMDDFYAGLHPADRDFVSAEYAAAADPATRALYDVEYRTIGKEDGIERWVAAKGRGVFDDEGRCVRVIGTAIDITARKTSEERLRELNENLEHRVAAAVAERNILADLVEGTDAFVQVADLDYRLLAINRASAQEFERVFGVRPHVGDSLLDLLADQPEHQAAIRRVWSRALAGEEFTEVLEFGDPAGDRRFYEMKFNILRDANGKTIGAYQFVDNVSERMRNEARLRDAERALRNAQKMEAIGQLTGGVAHDFNNLLMAISGGLRLIGRPLDDEKRERVLAGMSRAVERGVSLTRQLLAFSRRQPLATEPINLTAQVAAMRELIERSLGGEAQVMMNFPDDLWTVEADPGELELAVLNLCVNARDAMPSGGVIMIDASNTTDAEGATRRDIVELCVGDCGVGMSEEVIARACEPFFTTKDVGKGSGLGLAQVYAFITNSGGSLAIESKPGSGTTVRMRFPRSTEALVPAADEPAAEASASAGVEKKGHVLLVEDDREVAALSQEMLTSLGFDVTQVGSAEAALGALKNGRRIDIVFSDVRMPGGMNGIELVREIRRRNPRLPVVLTTGYAEGLREAEGEGIPVLPKPYQLEALTEILARQLR